MKFKGIQHYEHGTPAKVGVLITNLGTPDAPTQSALRRYLRQFLSDPRVVEVPRLLWWFILNLVILNIRPRRSAKAYASVWTERGSPLMFHTRDQCEALRERMQARHGSRVHVDFAMRYGEPSIERRLQAMQDAGVTRLLVLPLYPQYSAATTASTFDALAEDFRRRRWLPELRFINHYCDDPGYIEACAEQIRRHWLQHGRADKLILSYHGIPLRYLHNGDPYHCQCHKTTRLIAEALSLTDTEIMTCFQSRFGREEWLRPYTDETLKTLAADGTRSVQVFCPGFAADCLETIEEIGIENRDYFIEAGGENYQYIPALNAENSHMEALEHLVEAQLSPWLSNAQNTPASMSRDRAMALGASQ